MRITTATLLPYSLPLTDAWHTSATRAVERQGWLLRVATSDGACGFGDCAPLPAHGSETDAQAERALRQWSSALPGASVGGTLDALAEGGLAGTPAARAAAETALLDLAARAAGVPLWRHLTAASGGEVAVNALAGAAADATPQRIDAALAAGFDVIKLKLGVADPATELTALRRLAPRLPPHARLRLDANRAWDAETARRVGEALAGLPVEALEEPLAAPTPAALRALQRALPFAIAVDESWPLFDQAAFLADPPVRRLVLKLAVHGGLRPALATAAQARAAGVDCVVTTGIDSACGTLAAAHLAAAVGNGLAHGLATSSWLAADTGTPPAIVGGRIVLPDVPGLGFALRATPAASFPSC